jgi:hypothetical protein
MHWKIAENGFFEFTERGIVGSITSQALLSTNTRMSLLDQEYCRIANEQMERERLAAPPRIQPEYPCPARGIIDEREKQRLSRCESMAKATGTPVITLVRATEPFMSGRRDIRYRATFHPDGGVLWENLAGTPPPQAPAKKKATIVNGVLTWT